MSDADSTEALKRLAALKFDDNRSRTDGLQGYLRAAATLATFDRANLEPASSSPPPTRPPGAIEALLETCSPVDGLNWTLDEGVRIDTLKGLFSEGGIEALRAARAANEGLVSAPQRVLDLWLRGDAIGATSGAELRAALQVQRWLRGLDLSWVPSRESLAGKLVLAELLEPLQQATQGFFDRARQIEELLAWIALADRDNVRVAHGPGGSGKSALVARLLLAVAGRPSPPPWAYVDFDASEIDADDPGSVVSEILRQLGAQFPGYSSYVRGRRIAARKRGSTSPIIDQGSEGALTYLLKEIAPTQPFLLVLDTFEEVQYRGVAAVERVRGLLDRIVKARPGARILIAGRVALPGYPDLEVGGFSDDDAQTFLNSLIPTPIDPSNAKQLFGLVGTTPLSLRLTASVLCREGVDAFASVESTQDLLKGLHQARVEGLLYARVLGHLHGTPPERARLSRFAEGSLALRIITPAVVFEVLNPVLDLGLSSVTEAQTLVEQLGKEVAFVERVDAIDPRDGDPPLRHRPDLRALLVGTLDQSLGESARSIHRRAADHYALSSGPRAVSETLYHRLATGEDPQALKSLLSQADRRSLLSSIPELPPAAQAFLIDGLGADADLALPPELEAKRDLARKEIATEQRAEARLSANDATGALAALREQPSASPGGRLALVEARALIALQRPDEAFDQISKTAQAAMFASDGARLFDAALLGSTLAGVAPERRLALVRQALASTMIDARSRLRLRLRELSLASGEPSGAGPIHQAINQLLPQVSVTERRAEPGLVRELAAALGVEQPELMREALSVVGLGPLDMARRRLLAAGLAAWDAEHDATEDSPGEIGRIVEVLGVVGGQSMSLAERWYLFVVGEGTRLAATLYELSFKLSMTPAILAPLQQIYASWDDLRAIGPSTDEKIIRLRDILAEIYYETEMVDALLRSIGIPLRIMSAQQPVDRLWFEVIESAMRSGQLTELVSAVLRDPRSSGYQGALRELLKI